MLPSISDLSRLSLLDLCGSYGSLSFSKPHLSDCWITKLLKNPHLCGSPEFCGSAIAPWPILARFLISVGVLIAERGLMWFMISDFDSCLLIFSPLATDLWFLIVWEPRILLEPALWSRIASWFCGRTASWFLISDSWTLWETPECVGAPGIPEVMHPLTLPANFWPTQPVSGHRNFIATNRIFSKPIQMCGSPWDPLLSLFLSSFSSGWYGFPGDSVDFYSFLAKSATLKCFSGCHCFILH